VRQVCDSDGNLRYCMPVRTFRADRLLALCLGAIVVFFAQSMFCFAEHAGLIRCPVELEQHQSTAGSEEQSNAQGCHAHSPNAIGAKDVGVPVAGLLGEISLKSNRTAPDGPIRDIDYPPQLS
jgi:hypothetical protein